MRILLVEDDELLGNGTCEGLKKHGYTVDWVKDGFSAYTALTKEAFDLVVLDLGLPKMSGLQLLEKIRNLGITVPVLVLTARDSVQDKVDTFDVGADDYMVKPYDLDELCARLRALQRRFSSRAIPLIVYDELTLDPSSHVINYKGEEVIIPRREFTLLLKLLENVGKVLSRDLLTQTLYGWGEDIDSNTLEVHIHNIRKKFGPNFVRTIRGIGYMIGKKDEKNTGQNQSNTENI